MKALTGHWLLSQDHLQVYADAAKNFEVDAGAYEAFIARRSRTRADSEGKMFVRQGSTAHIIITGVLTTEPDFFFDMFGGGSAVFGDIVAAIEAAEADSEITQIILEIDSPGGEVSGFFRTAEAIAGTSKPIVAEVTNMATSAAFGLAAAADRIVAENPMTLLGSVGVAVSVFVSDSRIQIASTDAPNKRPDAQTDEGVAVIREELDAIHAEFAGVIARGRNTTVENVNANFGRGGIVIAGAALQSGMIDDISAVSNRDAENGAATSASMENDSMDLQELQAKHPDIYAAAVETGVDQERDRVTAHVEAGKAVGRPEIAAEFIVGGESFSSQTVQAKYLTAGISKRESDDRQSDDREVEGVGNGESQGVGDNAEVDLNAQANSIFDELEANLDITVGS